MKPKTDEVQSKRSPWPHRVSALLTLIVFPLIWVGGLVTTSDAGMAVPDWPNTYNYNMFAYPIRDWFFGPWDLFVEHGHRLLASTAGLCCIALVVVTYWCDRRRWVRRWSVLILILVVAQGVLGGQRVIRDDRVLALIHGCFGPLFFASVVAMLVFTSKWWASGDRVTDPRLWSAASMSLVSWSMLLASYGQVVLGACLRHIQKIEADPTVYQILILWHLAVATTIVGLAIAAGYLGRLRNLKGSGIRSLSGVLLLLVATQIGLGLTTYVVKFGWPPWFSNWGVAARFVVSEKSFWQMNLITAHVAVGSLILAFSTAQAVRFARARSDRVQAGLQVGGRSASPLPPGTAKVAGL